MITPLDQGLSVFIHSNIHNIACLLNPLDLKQRYYRLHSFCVVMMIIIPNIYPAFACFLYLSCLFNSYMHELVVPFNQGRKWVVFP
ncbi:hypothetical protein Hanom_Chr14g01295651 [Helianthus anomalus]